MKYSLVETDDFTENFESKHEFSVYPFVIKSENEISRLIARLLVVSDSDTGRAFSGQA